MIECFNVSFKEPALSPDPHDTLSPYEYFRLFVTTEMLQTIAFETNKYSLQRFGEDMRIPSAAEELGKCIGCYFWMGFVKMPNQQTFWEKDLSYTGVLSVLSRNWLERLIRTIHMVDNLSLDAKTKEDNKLWKIRSWLENLRQNFLNVSPDKFNSVDEIMVLFKGRSYLRQYLPNKRHKWGFKTWGSSGVSGFLYDFGMYRGCSYKSNSTFGVSGNVGANLYSTLPKQENHKVPADNFFTRLSLLEQLKLDGIWYTRTICASHSKNCSVLAKKDVKKKERCTFDYRTKETRKKVAVKWFENEGVTLASPYVGIEPTDAIKPYDRLIRQHVHVS